MELADVDDTKTRIDVVTVYFVTLALTIAIEFTLVVLARRWVPTLRATPVLSTCICLNLLTHPLASLACLGFSLPLFPVEMAVIIAEAVGYRMVGGVPAKSSIPLAIVANVASLIVGLVVIQSMP